MQMCCNGAQGLWGVTDGSKLWFPAALREVLFAWNLTATSQRPQAAAGSYLNVGAQALNSQHALSWSDMDPKFGTTRRSYAVPT